MIHRQGATGYLRDGILGEKQRAALEIVKTYQTEPLPCICGSDYSIKIIDKDRYGFPVNAMLCRNCGLIRTDPYFSEETLKEFYAGPYRDIDCGFPTFQDCWNHEYDQGRTLSTKWVNATKQEIGHRVCEIGCGAGGAVAYLNEHGHDAVGVDSGEIAEFGRKRGLTIFSEWPEDEKFDTVMLLQVFEHFRDPVAMFGKIRGMLKSGGYALINVPGIFCIPTVYLYDFQRYFILAHPWHYVRDTLAYVAGKAGLTMAIGTESVTAIFEKGEEVDKQPNIAPMIEVFLAHTEGIRNIYCENYPGGYYAMRKTRLGSKMLRELKM